jgi:hypothetical protein
MLTILAGVATWEREIMLERQRESIAEAKTKGNMKAGSLPSVRSGAGRATAGPRSRAVEGLPSVWREGQGEGQDHITANVCNAALHR